MSKQLAIASAISVMIMAMFVVYSPDLAQHARAATQGAAWQIPQISGFKTLFSF